MNPDFATRFSVSAERIAEIARTFDEVFADDSRYEIAVGGQAGWSLPLRQTMNALEARGEAGLVDKIAVAPYFPDFEFSPTIPVFDRALADGEISDAEYGEIFDALGAEIDGMFAGTSDAGRELAENRAIAEAFGLELTTYEGGQHFVANQFPDDIAGAFAVQNLAFQNRPEWAGIYERYLDGWEAYADGELTLYHLAGAWFGEEAFGHLRFGRQDPADSPKFQAVLDWIAEGASVPPNPDEEPDDDRPGDDGPDDDGPGEPTDDGSDEAPDQQIIDGVLVGTDGADVLVVADSPLGVVDARGGDDLIGFFDGATEIAGGPGRDTFLANMSAAGVTRNLLETDGAIIVDLTDADGSTVRLEDVERVLFEETAYVFDTASDDAAFVYLLYRAALGRDPDELGFLFWDAQRAAGATRAQIAEAFIDNPEFQARVGFNESEAVFVEGLYVNFLDRPGDTEGQQFWIDELESGRLTRAEVVLAFALNPEAIADQADAFENGFRVTVGPIFEDTDGGNEDLDGPGEPRWGR